MDDKEQTAFKIGSIYRDTADNLTRLHPHINPAWARAVLLEDGIETDYGDVCRLSDGVDPTGVCFDLVPGECDEQGNSIPTFTATLDHPAPTPKVKAALDLLEQGFKAQSKTPTLDKVANTAEPKRPRLTWADSKAVDPFDGYTVKSDEEVTGFAQLERHPTQILAESGAKLSPAFALAAVRQLVR